MSDSEAGDPMWSGSQQDLNPLHKLIIPRVSSEALKLASLFPSAQQLGFEVLLNKSSQLEPETPGTLLQKRIEKSGFRDGTANGGFLGIYS